MSSFTPGSGPDEKVAATTPATERDEEFLARLRKLGEDWRFSDEFIGLVVRIRFPRNYDDLGANRA